MDMHVDKSGQRKTSGKLGWWRGLGVGNSRNRAVSDFYRRVRAAVVHRVDHGDAGYLEVAIGGALGSSRSPQSKAVENTHCKILRYATTLAVRIMNVSIYSRC
jgi:hypothetical protein